MENTGIFLRYPFFLCSLCSLNAKLIAINNNINCEAKNIKENIEFNAKAIATDEVDKKINPTIALLCPSALVLRMKMVRETIAIKAIADSVSCIGSPPFFMLAFSHFPIIPLFSDSEIKKCQTWQLELIRKETKIQIHFFNLHLILKYLMCLTIELPGHFMANNGDGVLYEHSLLYKISLVSWQLFFGGIKSWLNSFGFMTAFLRFVPKAGLIPVDS
ncbi:hypothetical protein [Bacillus sp. ISL-45]|uniref:hypothetical protein n=1 Tax=Bacillus sp. ISL-45 TaxID=2819128 RepID=UPI001BE71BC0|nr:hypothetical protein [Bacillus sp. ISL-45]MBT2663143.1 hypothetical protein [Bacillus sp. ISL-45]